MKFAFLLFWLSLSIQPVFAQSVAQSSLDQIGRGATGYTSPEQAKAMMESMLKSLPPAQRLNIQKQLEAIKAEQSQIGAAYPGHSASTGAPSGAPFALPAGLKIGQITG